MANRDAANYVTCAKGHKVFVIWSPSRQCFGFTCDQCDQHSLTAISLQGHIKIVLVSPTRTDYKSRAAGEHEESEGGQ